MPPSLSPEVNVLPSGLNAAESTNPVCPSNWAGFLPLATSHFWKVQPPPPATRVFPSGLNTTNVTMLPTRKVSRTFCLGSSADNADNCNPRQTTHSQNSPSV